MRETEAIAILQTVRRNLNNARGIQDDLLEMGLCKKDFVKAIETATHGLTIAGLRRVKKRLGKETPKPTPPDKEYYGQ